MNVWAIIEYIDATFDILAVYLSEEEAREVAGRLNLQAKDSEEYSVEQTKLKGNWNNF